MALLGNILWETALGIGGAEADLQGQPPQSTGFSLQCAASGATRGRKLVWVGRDLTELKHKKCTSWEGLSRRDIETGTKLCRDRAGKGKAQLKLK